MENIMPILQQYWPILIILVMFYFMFWRPQKKQQKERANLLGSLKKGQTVVTIGGLHGEIKDLNEDTVRLQIANNVEVTFARSAIGNVVTKDNQ